MQLVTSQQACSQLTFYQFIRYANDSIMANHQKDIKKVATKAPKQHGAAKVPKYEQKETAFTVATSAEKPASKGKK